MKFVRVQITDSLHDRLKALTTHHGEYTFIIRKAIRAYVDQEETKRANNTSSIPNTPNQVRK